MRSLQWYKCGAAYQLMMLPHESPAIPPTHAFPSTEQVAKVLIYSIQEFASPAKIPVLE